VIGASGWNGMDALTRLGDFNADGHEDLIARQRSTGMLWLFPGTGTGFSPRVRLGASGWNGMREVTAVGDLNSDGNPDLVAVQAATGDLYFYPGQRTRLGARQPLGRGGWNSMGQLSGVGDFSGDGRADLVARQNATGDLWLYRGTGSATAFRTRTRLGASGWNHMRDLVGVGDFDRDGKADLVAVEARTSRLFLYAGRGTSLLAPQVIGTDWTSQQSPLA
jgi:hypothetical protein